MLHCYKQQHYSAVSLDLVLVAADFTRQYSAFIKTSNWTICSCTTRCTIPSNVWPRNLYKLRAHAKFSPQGHFIHIAVGHTCWWISFEVALERTPFYFDKCTKTFIDCALRWSWSLMVKLIECSNIVKLRFQANCCWKMENAWLEQCVLHVMYSSHLRLSIHTCTVFNETLANLVMAIQGCQM